MSVLGYLFAIAALVIGVGAGYFYRKKQVDEKNKDLNQQAQQTLQQANAKAKELVLEAKNEAFKTLEKVKQEEEKKLDIKSEPTAPLNIENVPLLLPPIERKPTRKVTLTELVSALNKAFEFKERKEGKQLRMRRAVERLIEQEEDIELRIKNIFDGILRHGTIMKFSDIVPVWKRKDIVETFMPLLYLCLRGKISCEQDEFFKEITIHVRGIQDEQTGAA